MAEKKQYYWLKLKKDFFKRHDIQIIEAMPNGKDYILFYLKLLCESVDHEGTLRFSDEIPYNENMLSIITNTNVDTVRSAVKIFTELKMMDIMDDGTYYMREVEKLIGTAKQDEQTRESTRLRVQAHRERQKRLQEPEKRYSNVTCNGEIDIDIDKEKEKEKDLICADARENRAKPKVTPEDSAFWKFAKENAELAETFYRATGIYPVKSQFGKWVNDLRDLAEAEINSDRLQKTIDYMRSENIQIFTPGSCLKTAQMLKTRGSIPAKSRCVQPKQTFTATQIVEMMEAEEHNYEVIDI